MIRIVGIMLLYGQYTLIAYVAYEDVWRNLLRLINAVLRRIELFIIGPETSNNRYE